MPSSVVAINQEDPKRLTSVAPFESLEEATDEPGAPQDLIDLENDMLYSADAGVGKVAGYSWTKRAAR